MGKEIIIIGGGIIGCCAAYYLNKSGHQVTIVDKSAMKAGASYVNAGYLSPSHLIPLSAPGVMKKGLKWMFDNASPLYIKPRLNLNLLQWAWAFNKSCTQKHVDRAAPIIKDICVLSQELIDDIKSTENFSFHYAKKGLFMLCKTEKALEEEISTAHLANELGLEARELTPSEIKQMEPDVEIDVVGAAYFKCDHHTTPNEFMNELKNNLLNSGVIFLTNESVEDLMVKEKAIVRIKTDKQELHADEVVLAAGSWSYLLSKKLGLKLLLQAGKGYRINTERPTGITIPSIFSEAKGAVTPMNGFTRFAGTMEIAGINHEINKVRVDAIARSVTDYYPEIVLTPQEQENAACGLRPVSPDGLPYIGKSKKCTNLTIATGHAMMGWSMGPGTGKLVQEIIDNEKPSMDTTLFNPDRKF